MKFSTVFFAVAPSILRVNAFPALSSGNLDSLTPEKLEGAFKAVEQFRNETRFIIDIRKPIDITAQHAFKAPQVTDRRGPCPGLNALANHGYISRTGITSFAEVVTAINQGMSRNPESYL
jgi:hypothetical protein